MLLGKGCQGVCAVLMLLEGTAAPVLLGVSAWLSCHCTQGFSSLPYRQWAQCGLRSVSLHRVCPPQSFPLLPMENQVVDTLLALSSKVSFPSQLLLQ